MFPVTVGTSNVKIVTLSSIMGPRFAVNAGKLSSFEQPQENVANVVGAEVSGVIVMDTAVGVDVIGVTVGVTLVGDDVLGAIVGVEVGDAVGESVGDNEGVNVVATSLHGKTASFVEIHRSHIDTEEPSHFSVVAAIAELFQYLTNPVSVKHSHKF